MEEVSYVHTYVPEEVLVDIDDFTAIVCQNALGEGLVNLLHLLFGREILALDLVQLDLAQVVKRQIVLLSLDLILLLLLSLGGPLVIGWVRR